MRRLWAWFCRQREQERALRDRVWVLNAIRDGRRLRFWATAAVCVMALTAAGVSWAGRLAIAGLLAGGHLAASLIERYGARHERFPLVGVVSVLGIGVVFGASCLAPDGRLAALFAFLIIIAYFAGVGGRTVALGTSVVALALEALREALTDPADRVDVFTLAVYAVTLVAISVIVDGVTRRQLRAAHSLGRLHEALRALSAAPDLSATLESVVAVAEQAVEAAEVVVLLVEDDHLVLAAPEVNPLGVSAEVVARHTGRELATGDGSPLAVTFVEGRTVVVADCLEDPRFPDWSRAWGLHPPAAALRSLISVPLRAGTEVIGVLQAYFASPGMPDRDAVQLIEAYAEQASLVIVRAQAYEQERRLTSRLTEADRLKSEFLALVSHELRTPLTAAKGFVDTVVYQWQRLDDEQRRELLTRASANADELTRLIGQLLDYSRIEGDGAPIDPLPTALAVAVDEVVESLRPSLASHEIVTDVPDDLVVLLDDEAFGHALGNLLTNAVKFAPAGSRITVAASEEEGETLLTVSDEGPGIPLEEQEQIFERFYQSPTHRAARRGAGLGLAIARRYAEAVGGRIWVESEPGEGATFALALRTAARGLTPEGPQSKLDQPV